jgi:nucleoside-diphosphate-sugar epimerase
MAPIAILRLGTAYGTRMRPNAVFIRFANAARRGDPVIVQGGGGQWRQLTHTADAYTDESWLRSSKKPG